MKLTAGEIRSERLRLGLTQAQLGFIVSVAQVTVAKWENGVWDPSEKVNDRLRLLFATGGLTGDTYIDKAAACVDSLLQEKREELADEVGTVNARLTQARNFPGHGPRVPRIMEQPVAPPPEPKVLPKGKSKAKAKAKAKPRKKTK